MPCSLTRSDVSKLVLEVIRNKEDNQKITESTCFWDDLGLDPEARRGYFRPIKTKIEAAGCTLNKVSPQDFENANDVKEIVDAVWRDVKEED